MIALDGNAIAGTLNEVFGAEMTEARCECAACGGRFLAAQTEVYSRGLGIVARCRQCHAVAMVFVTVRGTTCVDLRGLASFELEA